MWRQLIVLVLILGVLGCGTMFKTKGDKKEPKNGVTSPQKISFEIPVALRDSSNLECESNKYHQLTNSIDELEWRKNYLEENLDLTSQIIDEVIDRCQSFKLEEQCIIEPNILSYKEVESGEITTLGRTEFIKYSKKEKYQYFLKIDIAPSAGGRPIMGQEGIFEDDIYIESIYWSEDKKKISSSLYFENEYMQDKIAIEYIEKSSGDVEMNIQRRYDGKGYYSYIVDNKRTTGYIYNDLKIIKKNSPKGLYIIESKDDFIGTLDSFDEFRIVRTSDGEITNIGGYLYITDTKQKIVDAEALKDKSIDREYDVFTEDGHMLQSIYCSNSNSSCELDNQETWLDNSCELEEY